jgi:hypothetical protein
MVSSSKHDIIFLGSRSVTSLIIEEGRNKLKAEIVDHVGNCEERIKEIIEKGTRGLQLVVAARIAWNILQFTVNGVGEFWLISYNLIRV